jgi:hypothetical protein
MVASGVLAGIAVRVSCGVGMTSFSWWIIC